MVSPQWSGGWKEEGGRRKEEEGRRGGVLGLPDLNEYLRKFDYRFNRRKISDAERFVALFGQVAGRRLTWYCQTAQPENPYA